MLLTRLSAPLLLVGALCAAQAQVPITGAGKGAPGGGAGISLVQNAAFAPTCANPCGSIASTLNGTTVGNLLVVGVSYCIASCGGGTTVTVSSVASSNGGEICAQVPSAAPPGASVKVYSDVWYCKNIVGGNDTITITLSSAGIYFPVISFSEWHGANTSSPLDNIGTGAAGTSSSISLTVTSNTASSGELVYSVAQSLASTTLTAGQTPLSAAFGGYADEYQISGAIGSYSNTWTLSGSADWTASLAVFKQ